MKPLRERVRTVRRNLRVEGPQIARILVAAAVSWELCVWLGATQPPVFAVVVPLLAMRDAPDSALNVSVARLVGVVAGLSIGTPCCPGCGHPPCPSSSSWHWPSGSGWCCGSVTR
jgi:hypothetical protein